jgi:hypothetical protein
MKTIIILTIVLTSFKLTAQTSTLNLENPISSGTGLNNKPRLFKVNFDWLLETKAELINGFSYSPAIEFQISRPNGFNFQIQTGALAVFEGFKLDKPNPSAGLSVGYSF